MTDDTHTIRSGGLAATIKAQGAELCSLKDAAGVEFIWQAGPEWPRHAPLLFPIVGRLVNDELRQRGKTYRMTQHGFARDSRFAWADRGDNSCALVLDDSEATRALYPFAFRLVVTYTLDAAGLDVALTIVNTGEETLPASVGGHPAFNWPLQPGVLKESYALTFANEESFPVRRSTAGYCVWQRSRAQSKARCFPCPNPCSSPTPSSSIASTALLSAMRLGRDRGWKCPGPAFASSASGQSRQAPRSYASSRGGVMPAPRPSAASSATSRV
jgi:galactose mutarotase-like enzyme